MQGDGAIMSEDRIELIYKLTEEIRRQLNFTEGELDDGHGSCAEAYSKQSGSQEA